MKVENLVRMANEIGSFFRGTTTEAEAVDAIRRHLELYWDPRMREQIYSYATTDGSGLMGVVQQAVLQVRRARGPAF